MKISWYEPVSSQKYENEYRTKNCTFTVSEVGDTCRPMVTAFNAIRENYSLVQ